MAIGDVDVDVNVRARGTQRAVSDVERIDDAVKGTRDSTDDLEHATERYGDTAADVGRTTLSQLRDIQAGYLAAAAAVGFLASEEERRRDIVRETAADVQRAGENQMGLNLQDQFQGDAVGRFLQSQGLSHRLFVDLFDPIRELSDRVARGDEGAADEAAELNRVFGFDVVGAAGEGGAENLSRVLQGFASLTSQQAAGLPDMGISVTDVVEARPAIQTFLSAGGAEGLVDFYGEDRLLPSHGPAAQDIRNQALDVSLTEAEREARGQIFAGTRDPRRFTEGLYRLPGYEPTTNFLEDVLSGATQGVGPDVVEGFVSGLQRPFGLGGGQAVPEEVMARLLRDAGRAPERRPEPAPISSNSLTENQRTYQAQSGDGPYVLVD